MRGVLAPLIILLVVAGCTGQSPRESGMRAYVDERGQVRYAEVPESEQSREEKDTGEDSDSDGAEPDTIYTLENFPDASEKVPQDESLYYTWRDAEGQVHNTPYDYSEESLGRAPASENRQQASTARVTERGGAGSAPYDRDSGAAAILGLDGAGNRLDAFAESCCSDLPRFHTLKLEKDRGVDVSLTEDDEPESFSTGSSRFALVRLPETGPGRLLRVCSYVREGVFLPNLAFLNADFEPVRLVTDIVFDYSPETWRRYGYLEAFIPLRGRDQERWVLVFTREKDVESATTVEGDRDRSTRLQHKPTGSFQLYVH